LRKALHCKCSAEQKKLKFFVESKRGIDLKVPIPEIHLNFAKSILNTIKYSATKEYLKQSS
jgi:hypothetical protein